MKKTLNFCDFCDEFARAGRHTHFSYNAKKLIFEHFEETGPDYDLDVVAICCDISESSVEDLMRDWDLDSPEAVSEYLEHNTVVIGETEEGFVFFNF